MARFSILDLALVQAGGSIADAFARTVDVAQHAERWGYTRFWLAEHHNMPGIASAATSVLIGHVAGKTSTIRVGAGGVMLPNHSALVIAEQFGTLETLYPGRIDLGLGRAPGSDVLTARALRRVHTTGDEFPQQVRELLAYLSSEGKMPVRAVPGYGTEVPVWLLGSSTFSAQLSAELGLPFAFASHFAPELLYEALYLYRRDFRPSRYRSEPYVMVGVPLVAAEDDAEAQRLATTLYLRGLRLIRGEGIHLEPPVENLADLWSPAEQAAVTRKLSFSVIGGRESAARKIEQILRETRADELMFTSDLYDHGDRLRSFRIASDIMSGAYAPVPSV